MSPKTNSYFTSLAVVEMVWYSDAEFIAFWKKKSSKKKVVKEAEAIPKVRAIPEGEAVSVVPISKVAEIEVEVFTILPKVSRDADVTMEPSNAPNVAKVASKVEAPGGEGSPVRAVGESQPIAEASMPKDLEGDVL